MNFPLTAPDVAGWWDRGGLQNLRGKDLRQPDAIQTSIPAFAVGITFTVITEFAIVVVASDSVPLAQFLSGLIFCSSTLVFALSVFLFLKLLGTDLRVRDVTPASE